MPWELETRGGARRSRNTNGPVVAGPMSVCSDELSLGVALFVLGYVGLGHVDDLLLLTARKPGSGLKNLAELAAWSGALS